MSHTLGACDGYPGRGWTVAAYHDDGRIERLDGLFPSLSAACEAKREAERLTTLIPGFRSLSDLADEAEAAVNLNSEGA